MKVEKHRLSEYDRDRAKELYMDFMPVSEIAKKINVPATTLYYYASKSWREERETFASELLSEVTDSKKAQLTKIAGLTTDVLIRSLKALSERDKPLTVQEASQAAKLYEILDKILKLDAGNPTDIIANNKPATIVEIRERLNIDPFSNNITDAEIVQEAINEETSTININQLEYDRSGEDSEEDES